MNATLLGRARRLALPLAGVAALTLAVCVLLVGNSAAANGSADTESVATAPARAVIAQLQESGSASRAWLGVQVQNLDRNIADSLGLSDTRGALISEVQGGGPADAAGMHAGDVIVAFDGKPVGSAKALTRLVGETPAHHRVSVTVWRDGRKRELSIRLGNAADSDAA